jgi:hypothetical protein
MKSYIMLASAFVRSACSSGVTLKSSAFPTSRDTGVARIETASVSPSTTVTHFSFCLERVRLYDDSGNTHGEDEGKDYVEFKPGLIDVSDGLEKEWGSVPVPTGFRLKSLRAKVHQDRDLCGVDHSVKFNDLTTQQDLEFKFDFDPAVELAKDDVLKLTLNQVIADLRTAASGGGISSLKDRIEAVTGTGSKQ